MLGAYLTLFLTAFGAATILPLPSEGPFAYVVLQTGERFWPVLIATTGNYLGACTTYVLARAAVARLGAQRGRRWQHASVAIRRFGAPALLCSWVPIIGDALVAVAGASSIRFATFSFYVIAGKAGRYAVLAWALTR